MLGIFKYVSILALLVLLGCTSSPVAGRAAVVKHPFHRLKSHNLRSLEDLSLDLPKDRRGFVTHLITKTKNTDPVPTPPRGFQLVRYDAPLGRQPAIISVPRNHRKRHPAIIWIIGGFDFSVGDTPWAPATPDNDQSARAFPAADIITMYPSLRGGNNGRGFHETFYGEVDDVIAAERYLAARPDVDPTRIYLGGHSTGGTLALLVAESTRAFRAVFAFGAVGKPASYGQENCTFNIENEKELRLRSPDIYLGSITSPTFAFEGAVGGNLVFLQVMSLTNSNPNVHLFEIPGETHFSTLAKVTPIIAKQILADTGRTPKFNFLMAKPKIKAVSIE